MFISKYRNQGDRQTTDVRTEALKKRYDAQKKCNSVTKPWIPLALVNKSRLPRVLLRQAMEPYKGGGKSRKILFLFCNWVQHFRGNPASCLLTAAQVSILILVIYDVAPLRHDYILNVEIHSYELSLNLILCTTFSLFNHFNSLYMFVVNLSLSIKHSVGSVCVLAPRLQLSATALTAWVCFYAYMKCSETLLLFA